MCLSQNKKDAGNLSRTQMN